MAVVTKDGRHFAGTPTRLVLDHVRARLGEDGIAAVLAGAGETRPIETLLDETTWSSYTQFRRLLEVAAELLGGAEHLIEIADTTEPATDSIPEVAALLQSLGSPSALFETFRDGDDGVCTITTGGADAVGPAEWLLWHAFVDGFEPFPEHCSYMLGILGSSLRLFGMRASVLVEDTCVRRGDDRCTMRIAWDESDDLTQQLAFARTSLGLARSSLQSFHESVGDLVSADDLETVLARIVRRATRSSRAPGFVLALEPLPWTSRLVYTEGLEDDQAAKVAARVLGGDRAEELGLVVDVTSTRRHYGYLVAVDPAGSVAALDQVTLQAYGRLAASALDSALALAEARRQADTAHALLALAAQLANPATPEELAQKVARAMPAVIDCDMASVVLVTEGVARLAATHRADGDAIKMDEIHYPIEDIVEDQVDVYLLDEAPEPFQSTLVRNGLVAMTRAPIIIDGEVMGLLVASVVERPERLLSDPHLQERFSGLAGQTAVALRNSRLVEQIRHQALHDILTGLPNRALILDRTEQMLVRARRSRTATAALFIDLDGFKEVNDTLGHAAGDELLRSVAARLQTAVRDSDTVGRLGGDEFVVLSEGVSLDAGPEVVAERMLAVLRAPFVVRGSAMPINVSASIGVAVGDRASAGDLLRDADIALYHAKGAGKNCFSLFAPEMQAEVRDRVMLSEGLVDALAKGQYFLVYQPIFDLQAEVVTGVEALLRWRHPERGVIAPDAFIPMLEDTGLIIDVGRWVLRESCRQTAEWHAAGHRIDVSVNASVRQLERQGFVDDVRQALADTGLPPSSVIIEITETAIMRDAEATVAVLRDLKALGVRIAIDDFGTGYSSLAYLRQFPVDGLKIDRSFISAIADSPAAGEMIHTLVQLGKALQLETYAEGIESREQFDRLQHEGCDSGQGFMFARPLEPLALSAFLEERLLVAPTPEG